MGETFTVISSAKKRLEKVNFGVEKVVGIVAVNGFGSSALHSSSFIQQGRTLKPLVGCSTPGVNLQQTDNGLKRSSASPGFENSI